MPLLKVRAIKLRCCLRAHLGFFAFPNRSGECPHLGWLSEAGVNGSLEFALGKGVLDALHIGETQGAFA